LIIKNNLRGIARSGISLLQPGNDAIRGKVISLWEQTLEWN